MAPLPSFCSRFGSHLLLLVSFLAVSFNGQAATLPSALSRISDFKVFDAMATKPVGVVQTGKVVKFLIDNRAYPKPPQIYYINGNFCDAGKCPAPWVALHRMWAEKKLPGYNYTPQQFGEMAYYSHDLKSRKFIEGRLETFEKDGKVFLGVWFVEFDEIRADMIRFALEQVQKTFSAPGYDVDFVAFSSQQATEMNQISAWLQAAKIHTHLIGDLMANSSYSGLNVGEAWGFLNFDPKNTDDLEPNEIPVFTELPLDLSVVAATITTSFQDIASHVNLKAKERGTPNMVIRDPIEIAKLQAQNHQPIHLVVKADSYLIEPTTAEVVAAKLGQKINKPWKLPRIDLSGSITQYDGMCNQNPAVCLSFGARYGGKASRLGFLAHPKVIGMGSESQKSVGYRLTPLGLAIPTNLYKRFVDYNALINPEFKEALDDLINSEMGLNGAPAPTNEARKTKVERLKALFLTAQFPVGMYEEIAAQVGKLKEQVAKQYPGEDLDKLKIRSSANVEDVEDFDGAGLHDSFAARVSKSDASEANSACSIVHADPNDDVKTAVKPKSVACAIKATFGSLWNLRAVRERSYHRFDHRGAYMGLAILPGYAFRKIPVKTKIAANSVLITRVLNTEKVYGYQISTQAGDNLVTNPTPGTIAELTNMTFQTAHKDRSGMTVFRYATPVAGQPALTAPVLDLKKMQKVVLIGTAIEEAYCRAQPDYFVVSGVRQNCGGVANSQRKPKSLDIEIKYLSNGEILFKQAREFSGH